MSATADRLLPPAAVRRPVALSTVGALPDPASLPDSALRDRVSELLDLCERYRQARADWGAAFQQRAELLQGEQRSAVAAVRRGGAPPTSARRDKLDARCLTAQETVDVLERAVAEAHAELQRTPADPQLVEALAVERDEAYAIAVDSLASLELALEELASAERRARWSRAPAAPPGSLPKVAQGALREVREALAAR